MIIVETPVSSIEDEILRLRTLKGPHSQLYARGAIEALQWILHGYAQPSQRGVCSPQEERRVH